ncbi:hypothetical protein SEA_FRANKLIN22_54 [Microbacterium phage Franklin22]|uniref:hypothetical protein n=1 Tax=Microbacterium phage Franklin22 TaxID=2894293 RepID=UPI001E6B2838|nr:hypothetical protein QDW15_gp54 [Microbacterium phage Franklin22]UGL61867.1 hypothetical protein SEA_FRANKLIN22_54 [Microbacterium phage Franklin22]
MTDSTTTFQDALDAKLERRTAGALPSSRTFDMVTQALESGDPEVIGMELQHSRAHYQSLEYMLNSEQRILDVINEGIEAGEVPTPTNVQEALALAVRFINTVALEAAYDTAHGTGFFVAVLGMNVQSALQNLYPELDHSDPEREVSDEALAAFLAPATDDEL